MESPPPSLGCEEFDMDSHDHHPLLNKARLYIQQVRMESEPDRTVYEQFLEVVKAFKAQKIDSVETMEKVTQVLYDKPHLVLEFNAFVPKGYKIIRTGNGYFLSEPMCEPRRIRPLDPVEDVPDVPEVSEDPEDSEFDPSQPSTSNGPSSRN